MIRSLILTTLSCCLLCLQLSAGDPSLEAHLFALRDPKTERPAFRHHLKKVGEWAGHKVSTQLPTKTVSIETVLGKSANHKVLADVPVVVICVLRAGLPMFEGVMNVLSEAEGGFLIYQRDHETLKPKLYSVLLPSLENKYVVLVDPMIATAGTILDSLGIIMARNPKKVFVAGVMATQIGVQRIRDAYPAVTVLTAVVDPILNNKGYIVPGLGDAGDRSFGVKSEK